MKRWLTNIYYSCPVQLLILHLSSNWPLLLTWGILSMLVTGVLGSILGFKYLFLTPEYLGEVGFASHFLLGLGFGGFVMTWNLSTYLLEAHRFPFLATLERPFTKYCLNNFLFPFVFTILYITYAFHFQLYYELRNIENVLLHMVGYLTGTLFLILLSVLYFHYTNKDILSFLRLTNQPSSETDLTALAKKGPYDFFSRRAYRFHPVIKTYLNESLRPRLVRRVDHYDPALLWKVFKQNHFNALFVQLLSLVLLLFFSIVIDNPYFMIPAGASIFIFSSIFLAVLGALTYWFHEWRILVIVLLLFSANHLTKNNIFFHKNKGYGLDYQAEKPAYNYSQIRRLCTPEKVQHDKERTINILDNWKVNAAPEKGKRPKMIVICVTGGGLRAALWAMHVIQKADQKTEGQVLENTALITGSSGGLIGMGYLRELLLRSKLDQGMDLYNPDYLENISKDLLNPVAFALVSNDLFLPMASFSVNGHRYRKDRGYVFERALHQNTDFVMDKRLEDYRVAEEKAIIPMLFVTPSIINDGRRLVISPHPVSYMMVAPAGVKEPGSLEIDAIDFGALFSKQSPEDLRFSSALRMNATYPYVLPNVYLPSEPGIEVLDAGFRDNYGIMSAARFIHVFQEWIRVHTSGLILIQVRGKDKFSGPTKANQGVIESILNPFGVAGQLTDLQEFEHDSNLGYLFDLLGEQHMEIIRFTYRPKEGSQRASVTFHLTPREKADILQSLDTPDNQASMDRLISVLQNEMH